MSGGAGVGSQRHPTGQPNESAPASGAAGRSNSDMLHLLLALIPDSRTSTATCTSTQALPPAPPAPKAHRVHEVQAHNPVRPLRGGRQPRDGDRAAWGHGDAEERWAALALL